MNWALLLGMCGMLIPYANLMLRYQQRKGTPMLSKVTFLRTGAEIIAAVQGKIGKLNEKNAALEAEIAKIAEPEKKPEGGEKESVGSFLNGLALRGDGSATLQAKIAKNRDEVETLELLVRAVQNDLAIGKTYELTFDDIAVLGF